MISFNQAIKNIIAKFSYPFYVVQQDFKVKCVCVDHTTKQGKSTCEKCLGLGHKIKIKKIRGASEDKRGTFRNRGLEERSTVASYFIDSKYPICRDNVIVDGEDVFTVYRLENKKTPESVYNHCYAVPKKNDVKIFLENFNKITGRV